MNNLFQFVYLQINLLVCIVPYTNGNIKSPVVYLAESNENLIVYSRKMYKFAYY